MEVAIAKPGIYKKGKRTRICLGQEGFWVYYKTPSDMRTTSGVRLDIWAKWAKGAEYQGTGAEQ